MPSETAPVIDLRFIAQDLLCQTEVPVDTPEYLPADTEVARKYFLALRIEYPDCRPIEKLAPLKPTQHLAKSAERTIDCCPAKSIDTDV